MANLTLAISDDLKKKMSRFPEINWSVVARQAIEEKTRILETMQKMLSQSDLAETDAITIGRQIKRKVAKKH